MGKGRLEPFSDGVIAIIITIMVLEMKVPHGTEWVSVAKLWPVFISYVLSFVFIGIYWNNHHHLLHTLKRASGSVLWANLHLLFWLSLIPFTTGWMGENHFASKPTALYGFNLLMSGVAYFILSRVIIASDGCESSLLAKAVGSDFKAKLSLLLLFVAIPVALWQPMIASAIYAAVAVMWLLPDQRIERMLTE